jgi:hypothetical protein
MHNITVAGGNRVVQGVLKMLHLLKNFCYLPLKKFQMNHEHNKELNTLFLGKKHED